MPDTSLPMVPTYAKGHVRHPNKDHIMELKARAQGRMLHFLGYAPLPDSFDCRQLGWVGPIKDQRQCGSCWDFSGTCVVESAYYRAGVWPNDGSKALSEQYTLDCGRNGGCGGDDNITVLQWAKQTGLPFTSDYGPYEGQSDRCKFTSGMTMNKIDDWGFCDPNNQQGTASPQLIMTAMQQYGPIGSGVAADNAFSNYSGGVFDRTTSEGIDHDIVLVGWQVTSKKTSFGFGKPSVTASNGYWILRNSWNTSWGMQGYMNIGWGINRVGNEACWAVVNAQAPPIDWTP